LKAIAILIALQIIFLPNLAIANDSSCPFPLGAQASIGASKEAIAAKNSGTLKKDLIENLQKTENQRQISPLLNQIINEVYDYPTLRPEVYAAYRFELCFAMQSHPNQAAEIKFSDALPLLQKCELIPQEGARPPCAMEVVHTISGIPKQ
jgi:hypothetical protein